MSPVAVLVLFGAFRAMSCEEILYPEERSDLQKYQDASTCFPDIGEWYQIYRNYYFDPNFGGTAKCVMYKAFGEYSNFSMTAAFIYGERGTGGAIWGRQVITSTPCYTGKNVFQFVPLNGSGDAVQEMYHTIYAECDTCFVVRHRYVANGYGCSFWRRVSTFHMQADCCEFIYDENCGSTPKYQVYLPSCAPELGMPGI